MENIEEEIKGLERRIGQLKASKPAHDFTGTHEMEILRLEEEREDKRKTLRNDRHGDETNPADH